MVSHLGRLGWYVFTPSFRVASCTEFLLAVLQAESTRAYMTSSFKMQCTVGRFYINTLCLRDMHQTSDITEQQMPCIQASVTSAMDIQDIALVYGADRLGHSTDFTLVSVAVSYIFVAITLLSLIPVYHSQSAALFLLKMIKLLPLTVDIQKALSAVRTTSHLLSSAPIKQYHFAVAAALTHLESQLSPASTAFAHAELPTSGLGEYPSLQFTDEALIVCDLVI